ncbi:MAG: hypothetical protein GY822_05715 [Deltaproteobacteria bacterium]|nr:hypothetical protein [Deltaproteobacteria bacterium]
MTPWVIDQIRREREQEERPALRIPLEPSVEQYPPEENLCTDRGIQILDISPDAPNTISI